MYKICKNLCLIVCVMAWFVFTYFILTSTDIDIEHICVDDYLSCKVMSER